MRLTFEYRPVRDLESAATFYRDVLGLSEAWREGDDTVAFTVVGTEVELMLGLQLPDDEFEWFAGPMFEVDDLARWQDEHVAVVFAGPVSHTPPVRVLPCRDSSGNGFYVYELDSTPEG